MKIEMYLPVTGRNMKKRFGFPNTTNKILMFSVII